MATKNLIDGLNNFSTNLTSNITASDTTIALDSVADLPAAQGILVIDRVNSAGVATPTLREYIRYSSVSGSNVVLDSAAVGRGFGGSTAQTHSAGAVVEMVMTAEHHNLALDAIAAEHSDAGAHDFPDLLSDFDGWQEANETWAYASASTITVPSGAASKYRKGDKIKLTQTTAKYFYVTAVADTVLTVSGGTNYTVADAAITLPFYSHAETPIGFPDFFNYTPTLSAYSGTAPAVGNGTIAGRFSLKGNKCYMQAILIAGSSTTFGNGGALGLGLPIAATNTTNIRYIGPATFYDSNTTTLKIGGIVTRPDLSLTAYALLADANAGTGTVTNAVPWTWATSDEISVTLTYEI